MISLAPLKELPVIQRPQKQLLRQYPNELSAVTEAAFGFSNDEVKSGVLLAKDSKQLDVWQLLANVGPGIVHPYSNGTATSIDELGRSLTTACHLEMQHYSEYLSISDRLHFVVQELKEGKATTQFNGPVLKSAADTLFRRWEVSKNRVMRLQDAYAKYRDDRLLRLRRAIELCEEIGANVGIGEVLQSPILDAAETTWTPNAEFIKSLKMQFVKLQAGVEMTDYYKIQNCVTKLTGRPLFSPLELTPDLVFATKDDPYHRSPILGNIEQRIKLVAYATMYSGADTI